MVASYKNMNKTVVLTAAQLRALRATPITVVPAPGTNLMLQFLGAHLVLDYTAPAFTESADNIVFRYNDGSGVVVSQVVECTGFIDQTADTVTSALPCVDPIVAKSSGANKKLVIHNNGDGEWGGTGGSTLQVTVFYRIISVPA